MKIMSNGWILNTVAKPAKEGKYLICTDSGYISDVSYYEYGWNKSSPDSENEFKNVYAWMPLPELPEGLKND